jgi:hypothetical protein
MSIPSCTGIPELAPDEPGSKQAQYNSERGISGSIHNWSRDFNMIVHGVPRCILDLSFDVNECRLHGFKWLGEALQRRDRCARFTCARTPSEVHSALR